MTDAAWRAQLAAHIATADAAELGRVIDALETALVARVVPQKAALMRAAVHGIRLTLARARRQDAAAPKEVR